MAGVNLRRPGKGSRRRIARIRWTRWEIVHAFLLFLLMAALSIWAGIWIATHHFG